MGFENGEISGSKNPSLASTTVRNLNGVHEELQNKDPVSKEEIKELENELLQINIRDDIKERIHKNFLKIVSNTVLNRADLNILKKQISISKFRDNEVFSPPGEFSKLEGYLIKYTHSPLSKGTKERTSVEKFIAEFLYICTKRGTEGNPELPLTLEEIKTVIYTNISKDQKLILVLADFFKYTGKDKFVFLIKPNNAENLPFNFTIYKTAFDREQNSQSQIQSIQNNTSKESSKKAINGNGYTKNKDKKSDQQFKNLNIPQPKNILVTKEKGISKKEENNAKINSRNTEKTIEPESNDQEIYQKLSALGFPGNKEGLIQYQVARKFIKNAKSPGAGKVGKLTKKNIEAAYQILTIAQKESEGKIISKKLLKEEYVQYYPNKKNKKEWDKNFKLRDFILKNGLPESTQKILFDLLKDVYGSIKIQNHTQQILANTIKFIWILLGTESAGGLKYIKNRGTAESYFQYLSGVKFGKPSGPWKPNKACNGSPFQTALSHVKMYYEKNNIKIPRHIDISCAHPLEISPMDLTAEQSLNLFLIDFFAKCKSAQGLQEMRKGLIDGKEAQLVKGKDPFESLYEIHHTGKLPGKVKNLFRFHMFAYNQLSLNNNNV